MVGWMDGLYLIRYLEGFVVRQKPASFLLACFYSSSILIVDNSRILIKIDGVFLSKTNFVTILMAVVLNMLLISLTASFKSLLIAFL